MIGLHALREDALELAQIVRLESVEVGLIELTHRLRLAQSFSRSFGVPSAFSAELASVRDGRGR